jgi:hypothetical protein
LVCFVRKDRRVRRFEYMPLSEPFEILELSDGVSVRLRAVRFEWGSATIHPRYAGAPPSKEIPVLRVHLAAGVKPVGVPYWDVTSKTLQAQLKPLEPEIVGHGREFVVTAHGSGPGKRFSVRLE